MACWARSSMEFHEASQSAPAGVAPAAALANQTFGSAWTNSVATRSGSGHCRHGSTAMTRAPSDAALVTYSPSALESHGAPSCTTTSGSGGPVRAMASAAATKCALGATARERIGEHRPTKVRGEGEHVPGVGGAELTAAAERR